MRKIMIMALSLAMAVTMTACGKEKVKESVTGSDTVESYQSSENEGEVTDTPASNAAGDDISGEDTKNQEKTDASSSTGSKILVVYFSRAENIDYDSGVDAVASASINADKDGNAVGNLRIISEYLQEETKGDLFSIHTVDKYPKGYQDTTDQAADEKDEDARPKLSNKVDNMEQYETILLGYAGVIIGLN